MNEKMKAWPLAPVSLAICCLLSACGGGSSTVANASAGTSADNRVSAAALTEAPAPLPESKYVNDASHQQAMASVGIDPSAVAVTVSEVVSSGSTRMKAQAVSTVAETDIYVSTAGDDAWNGSSDISSGSGNGPVRTLVRAQQLARAQLQAMATGAPRKVVRVVIAPGTYYLSSPLEFTTADSGIAGYPVVYQASQAGAVTISGGVPLGVVAAASASVPVKFAPPTALTSVLAAAGGQLYVNDRRAILARQPNVGQYWFVQRPVITDGETVSNSGKESFAPTQAALAWINGLPVEDRARAVVDMFQSWTTGLHRLSSLPAPSNAVRLAPRNYWPYQFFGADQRYFVENVSAALDAPGEWIWDSAGVRYIPRTDEVGQNVSAIMPMLSQLIRVNGDATKKSWAQYIEFRDINFAHTRYDVPAAGFADIQAASQVDAAIEVNAARKIVFDNVRVSHTGGYAIWFRDSVRSSQVSNSVIDDTGAGGVKIGLTAQNATDTNATGAVVVSDNRITNTGAVWPGAVGVWVGQSFDNQIIRNAIANTTYSAISVGWKWGYGGATSGRNQIKSNLLYNIGSGMLNDAGAIYLLGESPGTAVSSNYIREVRGYDGYGPGTWGIYADEGVSGATIQNNFVVGSESGGFHLNYGRGNTVSYNLFAGGASAEVRVSKTDPLLTLLNVTGNIFVPDAAEPFDAYATAPDVTYSGNILASKTPTGATINMTKCGTGCKATAMTANGSTDPHYINVTGLSAATLTSLQTTASNAGPIRPTAAGLPPVQVALPVSQLAPPLDFKIDVSGTPVGTQPLGLKYSSTDRISVISRSDAPAGRCLEFRDDATLVNSWDPYAWAYLNHVTGTSTVEFKVFVDAGANFLHEWRDDATPYRKGPSLRITSAGVVAGGATLGFAPNQWLNVKITAKAGANAGTWNLTVTDAANRSMSLNNIPSTTAGWKEFKWAGFISDAKVTSRPCLSDVVMTSN